MGVWCSVTKRKELLKAPPMRHRINTVSGYDLQKANKIKCVGRLTLWGRW